jgi:Ca2+-binding EF-hand superfamily protein
VFKIMKKKVNFMNMVSEVNRFDMNLTERDVRSMFHLFDQNGTGMIESAKLKTWARTGNVPRTPSTAEIRSRGTAVRPNVQQCIYAICGRSTNLLGDCFNHFPVGENVMIDCDEFRRCLLSRGLGKPKETKALFHALGGESGGHGFINVDSIAAHLPSKEFILKNTGTAPTVKVTLFKLSLTLIGSYSSSALTHSASPH